MYTTMENFLNESKQVGLLYHCTSLSNAVYIISEDKLNGTYTEFFDDTTNFLRVSTTRNKNFLYDKNPIQFVLDGDKLSDRYKIRPISYWSKSETMNPDENNPHILDESEEMIITPKGYIDSIKQYIVRVNIYAKLSDYSKFDIFIKILEDNKIIYGFKSTKMTYSNHPLLKNK